MTYQEAFRDPALPREFERSDAMKQYAKAFETLIERLKLRQWCIERAVEMGKASSSPVDVIPAAKEVFDFCCEDVAAWLARVESDG